MSSFLVRYLRQIPLQHSQDLTNSIINKLDGLLNLAKILLVTYQTLLYKKTTAKAMFQLFVAFYS